MFRQSTADSAKKSATKAAKKAKDRQTKEEKNLTVTFNTAAELEQALTALHKANPKFEFVSEKTADSVNFLTNAPITRGRHAGEDMEITVSDGVRIILSQDSAGSYKSSERVTYSVKRAAKIVGAQVGKSGLAS